MALSLVAAATTFALAVLPGSLEERRAIPVADPLPPPVEAPAAPAPAPEPTLAPAAAQAVPPAVAPELPRQDASPLRGLLLPGGALLALGGVALLFTLRKGRAPGALRIVESVSMGPKRSLVIAKVGDEELVLGCSEAGISLLSTRNEARPAAPAAREASVDPWLESFSGKAAAPRAEAPDAVSALARLFGKAGRSRRPSFDDLLADSAQDQELRRRLSEGAKGMTR